MTTKLVPGDQIHFLRSGLVVHRRILEPDDWAGALSPDTTFTTTRGQVVTLTADLLRASPWLNDPEVQVARFGEVVAEPGEFPAGLPKFTPGSAEQDLARDRAREVALAEPDESKREAALREVRRTYGTLSTSQTVAELAGSDKRFLRDR